MWIYQNKCRWEEEKKGHGGEKRFLMGDLALKYIQFAIERSILQHRSLF